MTQFDDLLSSSLKSVGESYEPAETLEAPERFRQRRRRRRIGWGVGATAFATAVLVAVVAVAQNAPVKNDALPPAGRPVVIERITVGDDPAGLTVSGDGVWVANRGDSSLSHIDALTNEVVGRVDLGGSKASSVAYGRGFLWTANQIVGGIDAVDPGNGVVVQSAPIAPARPGTVGDIVADSESVWVAAASKPFDQEGPYRVLFDPERRGDDELDFEQYEMHSRPELALSGGIIWAADNYGVTSFDARSDEVIRVTDIPLPGASDLAADPSGAFVLTQDGDLVVIDSATNKVSGRTSLGVGDDSSVAAGLGYVWIADPGDGGRLLRVDPDTLEVVGEPLALGGGPFHIETGFGAVWVTDAANDQVLRIDPSGGGTPAVVESPQPTPGPSPTPSPSPTPTAEPSPSPAPTVEPSPSPGASEPEPITADTPLRLDGIGAIDLGMTIEQASAATGRELSLDAGSQVDRGCAYATLENGPEGLAFMVVDGVIQRIDVFAGGAVRTEAGIGIGSTETEVVRTYTPSLEPHPYDPNGKVFVYSTEHGGVGYIMLSLIFETDGELVTSYRSGYVEPASFIEGCS